MRLIRCSQSCDSRKKRTWTDVGHAKSRKKLASDYKCRTRFVRAIHASYLVHFPPIIGRTGQRRVHEYPSKRFYLRHVAIDVCAVVVQCTSCVRNGRQYNHTQPFRLLPSCRPLMFVGMDNVRPFPKYANANQYL